LARVLGEFSGALERFVRLVVTAELLEQVGAGSGQQVKAL